MFLKDKDNVVEDSIREKRCFFYDDQNGILCTDNFCDEEGEILPNIDKRLYKKDIGGQKNQIFNSPYPTYDFYASKNKIILLAIDSNKPEWFKLFAGKSANLSSLSLISSIGPFGNPSGYPFGKIINDSTLLFYNDFCILKKRQLVKLLIKERTLKDVNSVQAMFLYYSGDMIYYINGQTNYIEKCQFSEWLDDPSIVIEKFSKRSQLLNFERFFYEATLGNIGCVSQDRSTFSLRKYQQ